MAMPDTTQVEGFDNSPIIPGWYKARVGQKIEERQGAKDTYANVEIRLENDRVVYAMISYADKALFRLKAFKLACGGNDTDRDINRYKGARLEVYVQPEKYTDKEGKEKSSNKVTEYRCYGESDGNPIPPSSDDDDPFK
jgi:hypothetical protein